MKNYSQLAQKILEARLLEVTFEVSPLMKANHKKVKFTKAECEINIRKGKQILVYDFDLDLEVLAEH